MATSKPGILVVDDDNIILESLVEMLCLENYNVKGATGLQAALDILQRQPINLIISDINMSGGDGFELLRVVKQRWPETAIIMITGYGTIESAVEAIRMGAYDYLTKPIVDDEIRFVVERALHQQSLLLENKALKSQLDMRFGLDSLIGHDHRMQRVYDLIDAVAQSNANVLIEGESGTGKSLVAKVIHHRSDRQTKPFVEVACGAIPESLLESELFGHVRGSFTGAIADKVGKFKAADEGTLFLDEIATASTALQVKLLRVIQERQFEAVGSNETQTVDARLIFATNKNLEEEVDAGTFRQDLYYRINVVTITVPALRDRLSDIPLLAEKFLSTLSSQSKKSMSGFTQEAMECLQRYSWPGNVRELENVVERAVVLSRAGKIEVNDLPPKLVSYAGEPVSFDVTFPPTSLKKAMEGPERAVIEAALKANNWNRQLTADMLEINRTTLYKKMKRYGLEYEPMASS